MDQESLRSALRDRTRGLHTRLDTALAGSDGRVADVAGYVRVLDVLHTMHAHADGPLSRWARTSPLACGLDPTLVPDRAAAYAADLAVLGVEVGSVERVTRPVGEPRGLALLYLVAGSAAGARVLLRGLPDAVPGAARRALSQAAGRSSTTFWRQTCALLARPVEPGLLDATVAEACDVLGLLIARQELVAR